MKHSLLNSFVLTMFLYIFALGVTGLILLIREAPIVGQGLLIFLGTWAVCAGVLWASGESE